MAAPTYCEIVAALTNAGGDVVNNRNRYGQAKEAISAANNTVGAMGTTYAAVAAEINAQVAANPNDVAWKNAKATLDKIVAEYQALKAKLQAAVDALNAIG